MALLHFHPRRVLCFSHPQSQCPSWSTYEIAGQGDWWSQPDDEFTHTNQGRGDKVGFSAICPLLRFGNEKTLDIYRSTAQSHLYLLKVVDWTPTLADETFLRDVQVEHVERVVDGFDLAHLDEPYFDVLSGCHQHAMTMILRLAQYLLQTVADILQLFSICS